VLCMRLFFGLALPGSLYRHPMKGAVLGDDHVVVIARPHESVLSRLEDLLQTMFFFFVRHAGTTRLAEARFPQERSPGLAGATRGSGTARRRRPEDRAVLYGCTSAAPCCGGELGLVPKTSKSTTPEAVKNAAIVRRLSRTLRLRAALVMSDAIDECPFRFNGKGTTAFLLRLKNSRNLKGLKKT
jgi:hypothetical protein